MPEPTTITTLSNIGKLKLAEAVLEDVLEEVKPAVKKALKQIEDTAEDAVEDVGDELERVSRKLKNAIRKLFD